MLGDIYHQHGLMSDDITFLNAHVFVSCMATIVLTTPITNANLPNKPGTTKLL